MMNSPLLYNKDHSFSFDSSMSETFDSYVIQSSSQNQLKEKRGEKTVKRKRDRARVLCVYAANKKKPVLGPFFVCYLSLFHLTTDGPHTKEPCSRNLINQLLVPSSFSVSHVYLLSGGCVYVC